MKIVSNNKGQGLLEYVIICALVAIFCLATVTQFGKVIEKRVDQMKRKISNDIKITL
jgi:cell division protein ZapA (FtsZ GTPase activity inhibitor)